MALIESAFGTAFLERSDPHPVRTHWARAKDFLKTMAPGQRDLRNRNLAFVLDLADAVEKTRDCENFREEVYSRLISPHHFEGAHYEMLMAAAFADRAEVKFIPSHGRNGRPGDFTASIPTRSIVVECTKKKLTPRSLNNYERKEVIQIVQGVQARQGPDLQVSVVVLGADLRAIKDVLQEAEAPVASVPLGTHALPSGGWMTVSDDPLLPLVKLDGRGIGVLQPAGLDFGQASVMMKFGEDGKVDEVKNAKRTEVTVINSHAFRQMVGGFKDKAGKIKPGEKAIICIGVDITRTKPEHSLSYLQLTGWLLGQITWSGGGNARIGALVLTADGGRLTCEGEWKCVQNDLLMYQLNSQKDFVSGFLPTEVEVQMLPHGTDLFR